MKKIAIIALLSFGLMSFHSAETESTISITVEYDTDRCISRTCVDNPDGTSNCSEWKEYDCKYWPQGPPQEQEISE